MTPREFLEILHVAERLKDTIRHSTTSKGREESVGEHSWRMTLMALLLKDDFQDINIDKVIRMCLIHDLGECFTGDIPVFRKTKEDSERENRLLQEWVAELPEPLPKEWKELYEEMEEQKTSESVFYKTMDKLEALIQHNEAPLSTWEPNEYDLQKVYAQDIVQWSDYMILLREEILKDTLEKIRNGQ